MTFSKRVGMEPASDLKKRIASLCEEAGFIVVESQTFMHREETAQDSYRHITTWCREPDWNPIVPEHFKRTDQEAHKDHQIEIHAFMGCDGTFDGIVELRCMAMLHVADFYCPTLRDCKIPLLDLPVVLKEVAKQMHVVIEARKRGEKGPWQFGEHLWRVWSP